MWLDRQRQVCIFESSQLEGSYVRYLLYTIKDHDLPSSIFVRWNSELYLKSGWSHLETYVNSTSCLLRRGNHEVGILLKQAEKLRNQGIFWERVIHSLKQNKESKTEARVTILDQDWANQPIRGLAWWASVPTPVGSKASLYYPKKKKALLEMRRSGGMPKAGKITIRTLWTNCTHLHSQLWWQSPTPLKGHLHTNGWTGWCHAEAWHHNS